MSDKYKEITKEFIANHKFENAGLYFEHKKENASFKLGPKSVLPMPDKQKEVKLRKKMIDIVQGQYQAIMQNRQQMLHLRRHSQKVFKRNKKSNKGCSCKILCWLRLNNGSY